MLILSLLSCWALAAVLLLLGVWRYGHADEIPPPPPPPDPITELVDKWAHDWERGRA